jgi:hypothetical protein
VGGGGRYTYDGCVNSSARVCLLVFAVVMLALSERRTVTASGAPWSPATTHVDSPAGEPSAQPQLTVSARGVLLSWIERAGARATLKFAERTATGWTPAQTAASGDDWFVNWADVPSVLRLDDGRLVAHWLQKSGSETYAYDVRLAFSTDEGRTWSPPVTPHHDGTKREHGFASLFQMPGRALGLVWLDGRAMASAMGHGSSHDAAAQGAMSVRFATFDSAAKQTSEAAVDTRVCECCPTTAAVTSDGPIVAFRNRSDDEIRDIYVSRLEKGSWTEPRAVFHDGWKIPGCPVNGPMLSARGQQVALAWFTGRGNVGHALVAFSSDGGRTFGKPIPLDTTSALGRVDVELLEDGTAVATWIEFRDQKSTFSVRRISSSGERSDALVVAAVEGARASGYPRIARQGNELVFAWTESRQGALRVRTAVADLSQR